MNEPERFFILKGCAGLGNRLSSLAWAIDYCKDSRRTLCVDWSDGVFGKPGENVFDNYFQLKGLPCVTDPSFIIARADRRDVFPQVWKGNPVQALWDVYDDQLCVLSRLQRIFLKLITLGRWKVFNAWFLRGISKSRIGQWLALIELEKGDCMPVMQSYPRDISQRVVVASDYNPSFDRETYVSHVQLQPEMQKKMDEIARQLDIDSDTIGIHLRQTDWKWGAAVDVLLNRLSGWIQGKSVKIFLATDSQTALDAVKEAFPQTIVYPKFLPTEHESSGGLHHLGYEKKDAALSQKVLFESIVDMYLLSRCGELWHQSGSTFSLFANVWADPSQKLVDWGQSS